MVAFYLRLPKCTDFLLLLIVAGCGAYLSGPSSFQALPGRIYPIRSRCYEVLPYNNYLLTMGDQKFYLGSYDADTLYHPGDSLCFYAKIRPFHDTGNPGEFSYAHYLKQKNVIHRLIPVTPLQKTGYSEDLTSYFDRARRKLLSKTARLFPDTACRNLIDALSLGYKNELRGETRDLFITTGTVHLLSVSGLHTGAIYLFIVTLLKSIGLKGKKQELIVLPLLWGYACLTGLSPSVVRAATILSFLTLGKITQRTYTPLNSVAASAFFTLLIRPHTLYSLSFLLSYSAYTGILTLYPFLFRLPGRLPRFPSYLYACFCLTISAQLPTLPIGAFYFHSVNINGFLANMIAVPLATILLYSAVVCLAFPFLFSQYLAVIPTWISRLLLGFLHFFKPLSVNISQLYPSPVTVCLFYICLICISIYLLKREISWLKNTFFSLVVLLSWLIGYHLWIISRQEILILQVYRQSTIVFNYRGHYTYLKNTTFADSTLPYVLQNRLKPLPAHRGFLSGDLYYDSGHFYTPRDSLQIIDKPFVAVHPCHTLIITGNIRPNQIFRDTTGLLPDRLICDGSNTPWCTEQWEEFCRRHRITFSATAESGCIRIRLK